MPRTVTQWSQTLNSQGFHVDTDITTGKDFASSASIVLAARKATLVEPTPGGINQTTMMQTDTPDSWEAIGLVQNASVSQNKQLAQIFEVGSKESYFVPGRTVVQAGVSRIMVDGDSLMKVMYPKAEGASEVPADAGFSSLKGSTSSDFYINLASDFFNNSLDLGFFFVDGENQPIGAFYLKDAHIQAHQISLASQQTVVLENISLRAGQVIGLSSA